MRPWMEKWGSVLLIFLCAAVIVFSALYTRQDDLRRIAAQNAAASQDETFRDVAEPRYCAPVTDAVIKPYTGAHQSPGGLWQFDPYVYYPLSRSEKISACCTGTLIQADAQTLVIQSKDGQRFRLYGSFLPQVAAPCAVAVGQVIASAANAGELRLCVQAEGCYIDPMSLITP